MKNTTLIRSIGLFILSTVLISSSVFAFGPNDGFLNKKTGQRIWLDRHPDRADAYTFFLGDAQDPTRGKVLAPKLALPMGSEIDPYQERYGTYNQLMAEAQIRFPSIPEIVLIYNLRRSTSVYLKIFKSIEEGTGMVECPPLYFEKYLEAIEAEQNR